MANKRRSQKRKSRSRKKSSAGYVDVGLASRLRIGSDKYFEYGMTHMQSAKGVPGKAYNPFTKSLVNKGGKSYESYKLQELFEMGKAEGFKKSQSPYRKLKMSRRFTPKSSSPYVQDNEDRQGTRYVCAKPEINLTQECKKITLHYWNGYYKRMRTLDFIRYLREHNYEYNCYKFDNSFFDQITNCLNNKLYKPEKLPSFMAGMGTDIFEPSEGRQFVPKSAGECRSLLQNFGIDNADGVKRYLADKAKSGDNKRYIMNCAQRAFSGFGKAVSGDSFSLVSETPATSDPIADVVSGVSDIFGDLFGGGEDSETKNILKELGLCSKGAYLNYRNKCNPFRKNADPECSHYDEVGQAGKVFITGDDVKVEGCTPSSKYVGQQF